MTIPSERDSALKGTSPPSAGGAQEVRSSSASKHELRFPEKSHTDVAVACGISLLAMIWVSPFFSFTRLHGDEGILLQGAVRILHGQIPCRDFFSFYTPGSYY